MKKLQMRKWAIAGVAALLVLGSTTIAFAKENNIEIDEKATKAVIIEAIEAAL